MPKKVAHRSTEVQKHKSGGYISRSKKIDGAFSLREKVNYPSNKDFHKKVIEVREVTKRDVDARIYDCIIPFFDWRYEIHNQTGEEILWVFPCTEKEAKAVFL